MWHVLIILKTYNSCKWIRNLQYFRDSKDVLLQTMLMKTLLKVATKYKTVLMVNAFPSSFLEPLLRMSLVQDPGIRRIVQEILHTLLDRHDNSSKLRSVRWDDSFTRIQRKKMENLCRVYMQVIIHTWFVRNYMLCHLWFEETSWNLLNLWMWIITCTLHDPIIWT